MESENNLNTAGASGDWASRLATGGALNGNLCISNWQQPKPWKFCPQCATELGAAWKFCGECGNQILRPFLSVQLPNVYVGTSTFGSIEGMPNAWIGSPLQFGQNQ